LRSGPLSFVPVQPFGQTRIIVPTMPHVKIYTTRICYYCDRAKDLLRKKNVEFEEIDVSDDPEMRAKLVEMTGGRRTVPQIWIGERHVGGFDDLYALEKSGELDALLRG